MINGRPLKSIVQFTPTTKDGTVKVSITFSSEGFAEGESAVVFEKIFDVATETEKTAGTQTTDLLVARHENLNDKNQTVTVHYHPPIPQTGEGTSASPLSFSDLKT